MMSTIFTILRAVFNLMLVVIGMTGIYLMYFEQPFLSYGNLPFPVLTPKVKPGEAVSILVIRCNSDNRTRSYLLSHTLVGGQLKIILPANSVSLDPGCRKEVSAVNVIPIGTSPGVYRVEGFAEVQGTIRASSIHWESESFEVSL